MHRRLIGIAAAALMLGAASTPAAAQTHWDLPLVWPQGNFHVKNAERFAQEVEAATDGQVVITIHSGGALGFKGPEMLKVIRDGLVPIGDILLNQQVGDAPFFGIESVPYLAPGYDDVAQLQKFSRPVYDEIAKEFNQKILYMVPWPPQAVYSKEPIVEPADLQGFTLRVVDKNGLDYFTAQGAVPRQLPWGEVVPALASGAIEGVTTSSSSGVDGKFWEFLCCMNRFNWQATSNMVNVNLDAWNALAPEHRQAIEAVAARLEPEFWNVSKAEDESKIATLRENGMEISDPTPELRAFLLEKAKPIWEEFVEAAGPQGREVIDAYLASTQQQ